MAEMLLPSVAEVEAASISAWLGRHAGVTYRTRLLELPEDFITYLKSEGPLILPKTKRDASAIARKRETVERDGNDSLSESDEEADLEFPQLEAAIDAAIASLGGVVFAKLNWSSPRDAAWISTSGNCLECRCAGDVFVLLKASDFAAYDACRAYDHCYDRETTPKTPLTLALRQWRPTESSGEFRCFVRGASLVAVCQRKVDEQFALLHDEEHCEKEKKRIAAFFDAHLRGKHPHPAYVFDLAMTSKAMLLVDINVSSPATDTLLFGDEELVAITAVHAALSRPDGPTSPGAFELRVVEASGHVRSAELSAFRAPADMLDLQSLGGIEELIRQCNDTSAGGDETDGDSEDEVH